MTTFQGDLSLTHLLLFHEYLHGGNGTGLGKSARFRQAQAAVAQPAIVHVGGLAAC